MMGLALGRLRGTAIMTFDRRFACVVVATCALLRAAAAQEPAPFCPDIGELDVQALLLPPPCDSCAITQAELAELQSLQSTRTPEMTEHARADYTRTPERFLDGMGIHLVAPALGQAAPLLKCAAVVAEGAVDKAKLQFNRTRPYKLAGNGLHPLKEIAADDAPSYPSGHSAFGSVTGLVLAAMDADLRDRFLKRIEDFGFSRLVSGVHYRSDVYSGELVGATAAAVLLGNAEFRKRIDLAAPDLRNALAAGN
jgi:acid phosphatase (class A)